MAPSLRGPFQSFDNDNDNDNDNEIIFIAKWYTNHVQKVMIKTKPVIGLLYMKHIEPGKGDVKPSWLMCPNVNYTKEIVFLECRAETVQSAGTLLI